MTTVNLNEMSDFIVPFYPFKHNMDVGFKLLLFSPFFFLSWVQIMASTQTQPNSVTGQRRIVQECLMVSIAGWQEHCCPKAACKQL